MVFLLTKCQYVISVAPCTLRIDNELWPNNDDRLSVAVMSETPHILVGLRQLCQQTRDP